jgi:hypothetical protein
VASGSEDEQTLWENRQGFKRILIWPRVMRDVSSIDTRCGGGSFFLKKKKNKKSSTSQTFDRIDRVRFGLDRLGLLTDQN